MQVSMHRVRRDPVLPQQKTNGHSNETKRETGLLTPTLCLQTIALSILHRLSINVHQCWLMVAIIFRSSLLRLVLANLFCIQLRQMVKNGLRPGAFGHLRPNCAKRNMNKAAYTKWRIRAARQQIEQLLAALPYMLRSCR